MSVIHPLVFSYLSHSLVYLLFLISHPYLIYLTFCLFSYPCPHSIFIVVLILILVFFSLPLFFSILIFILTHELCAFFFLCVCSHNSCISFSMSFSIHFILFLSNLPFFSCLILVHLSLLFPSSPFLPSHFLLHFISILICRFCRPPPAPSHSVVLSWSPKFPLISASYICNPVHNPR